METTKLTVKSEFCARLKGKSVRDCVCMLPAGGFWECPPEARGTLGPVPIPVPPTRSLQTGHAVLVTDIQPEPRTREEISRAVAAERAAISSQQRAAASGYTGSICDNCFSSRMVRTGVCETCLDCGTPSGGCS